MTCLLESSIRRISLEGVGMGINGKSLSWRRVLQHHRLGLAAPQDEAGREVGGMAEGALALNQDHRGCSVQ